MSCVQCIVDGKNVNCLAGDHISIDKRTCLANLSSYYSTYLVIVKNTLLDITETGYLAIYIENKGFE